MTQGNLINQSWEIGRSNAQCGGCATPLAAGTTCWATLVEMDAASAEKSTSRGPLGRFARMDFCETCWQDHRRPEAPAVMFSFWKTTIPEAKMMRAPKLERQIVESSKTAAQIPEPRDESQSQPHSFAPSFAASRRWRERSVRKDFSEPGCICWRLAASNPAPCQFAPSN